MRIGEVIEASTPRFVAQCYELDNPPPFGIFLRTTTADPDIQVYAVATEATTESLEPGRRIIARGQDEANPDDIYRHHPQLTQLLRTTCVAIVIGHRHDDTYRLYLPPLPARVHGFVETCATPEVVALSAGFDFLGLLLASGGAVADELTAASVREAARHQENAAAFLMAAGKALAVQLSGQPQRLAAILRRIRP